jgi:DNA repair exonuclease SbcCD nuclease subunit
MYKFIYFTDLHSDDSNNIFNRVDDFGSTTLSKLEEIIFEANRLNCDIYCGGDLINNPYLSHSYINRMIKVLSNFENIFYLVPGNHDILGRNIDSANETTIGILEKSTSFRFKLLRIGHFEKEGFYIMSNPYNEDIKVNDFSMISNFKFPVILIDHNMIIPMDMPFDGLKTDLLSGYFRRGSLVLCGHWHSPFLKKYDTVEFINIGSAGRLNRKLDQRDPQYLIVTLESGKYSYEYKKFLCAAPYNEVFKLDDSVHLKLEELNFNTYISENINTSDLISIVKSVGEDKKIDKDIIEELVKKIEFFQSKSKI